jgi:hypothetical protein
LQSLINLKNSRNKFTLTKHIRRRPLIKHPLATDQSLYILFPDQSTTFFALLEFGREWASYLLFRLRLYTCQIGKWYPIIHMFWLKTTKPQLFWGPHMLTDHVLAYCRNRWCDRYNIKQIREHKHREGDWKSLRAIFCIEVYWTVLL